ncbi:NAD-dependent epimerase/dehydratase family protein [Vibrio lentus]|uniref:NAD-dependent epimerase/dehydratase family protein n=1 Tax=Vibrio lentus TaxID=136468 RepID=UPI000C855C19|nr:NAD(P)-dependent oxidoreductase [Vibrio lentus]PMJ60544.1 NAD-dependent dehydratase [Vibrio lentus]PMM54073.1 NAD-dependent dehydratase [Vibrio lentus]
MRVLISGANGYIGRHVTKLFVKNGLEVFTYDRNKSVIPQSGNFKEVHSDFEGYFDVIINCARPHWSEFSPVEIADIEHGLLTQLDRFASEDAIKLHTSGVWLFGNASQQDLKEFRLKPLKAVELDVETIHSVIQANWNIVYCPSLVYGGDNCQLKRIIESYVDQTAQVAVPSQGHNQYVHVYDIAKFYLLLVQNPVSEMQHFIAETKGYSPAEFAQLLLESNVIQKVDERSWAEFADLNGFESQQLERLNLTLPVSPLFQATELIHEYIKKLNEGS